MTENIYRKNMLNIHHDIGLRYIDSVFKYNARDKSQSNSVNRAIYMSEQHIKDLQCE